MDLKKLYGDCTVLCGSEPPLYTFFVHLDMGVRALLARYPKKLLFSEGEYAPPETLSDELGLREEFYLPLLCFVACRNGGDKALDKTFSESAEAAYLGLWRKQARSLRRKGDVW